MPAKVILTVTQGQLQGQQYIFDSRTTCIIGRSPDCNPQLPSDKENLVISRYHCLLDINPPDIRIRDFGSKNGTYVNDKKIGQRQAGETPEEAAKLEFPEYDLQSGDEIKLGNTVFKINTEIDPEEINIPNFLIPTIPAISNQLETPNIGEIIKRFLNLANEGNKELKAIRDYHLVKQIGKGGCGEVYLAQHQPSGKLVALKMMLPAIAANERAVKMFLRETQNTRTLEHPNVIKLIDNGFFEGIFFFTMEYCDAGSVQDLIKNQGGKLPVDIAVPIILQVLNGLEYTHNTEIPYVQLLDGSFARGRGLIHRDLKPANIFLTNINEKLVAKIGDYGLSKAFDLAGLSGLSCTGNRIGTPVYIPRQQVLNYKYVQPDVDIWAVAASLYHMLTGYLPRNFTGIDYFSEVLLNDPIPIRQRDASIAPRLAEVIDLGLREKPEIYFKSAGDFKQALLGAVC
jgi:eukaryotic-like serine/threonine-protein kinase